MPHFPDGHTYDPCLHLFVDDHHVRTTFAVRRVFGEARKLPEPVLDDNDGRILAWGCARYDGGRYRLWYQSALQANCHEMAGAGVWGRGDDWGYYPDRHPDACRETQSSIICYAESDNGFDWHRPELGLVEWRGSTKNNILFDGSAAQQQFDGGLTNMDTVSVLIDDDAPQAERYKIFLHWETLHIYDNIDAAALGRDPAILERFTKHRAKYIMTSGDGICWDPTLRLAKKPAGGGDYSGITRDHRGSRWWCNDRAPVGVPGMWMRTAGLCASDDLYDWPDAVDLVVYPDAFEDWGRRYEHHGMIPFTYGDQDLAYLELSIKGAPIANWLLSHRDGRKWHRAGDKPLLEVGPTGSHDDTIVNAMRNPPLVVGDEMIIPYNSRHSESITFEHFAGRRVGTMSLATMRLDGWAGLEVDRAAVMRHGQPAYVQTMPITVEADELQLNIEGAGGAARVALLDECARPIDGYTLDACLPVDEGVRVPVRWRNRGDVRELKGRPVIVLVEMPCGTLWAVRL